MQGCSEDKQRNNWRCARAVRKRPHTHRACDPPPPKADPKPRGCVSQGEGSERIGLFCFGVQKPHEEPRRCGPGRTPETALTWGWAGGRGRSAVEGAERCPGDGEDVPGRFPSACAPWQRRTACAVSECPFETPAVPPFDCGPRPALGTGPGCRCMGRPQAGDPAGPPPPPPPPAPRVRLYAPHPPWGAQQLHVPSLHTLCVRNKARRKLKRNPPRGGGGGRNRNEMVRQKTGTQVQRCLFTVWMTPCPPSLFRPDTAKSE